MGLLLEGTAGSGLTTGWSSSWNQESGPAGARAFLVSLPAPLAGSGSACYREGMAGPKLLPALAVPSATAGAQTVTGTLEGPSLILPCPSIPDRRSRRGKRSGAGGSFTLTTGSDIHADGVVNDRAVPGSGRVISDSQLPPAARRGRVFDPGGSVAGTAGSNVFSGQGMKFRDLGAAKAFALREGHALNFRAELYNVNTVFGRLTNPQLSLRYVF